MRIIFFSRRFYPLIGGVEKHVLELGKRLVKRGHTVIVITEQPRHAEFSSASSKIPKQVRNDIFKSAEEIDGIQVYRIFVGKESRFKKITIWKSLWNIRKILKTADVIHCHDVFFWYLPFRLLYPTKPVYTTFHGYESFPLSKKAIFIRKFSEKLSFGNICIGDFIKKWYGTKPTFVSYGAVNSSKLKVENAKFRSESAVFIGRLDEQTGIVTYANAVETLKKKFPKFDFLVVGDGKDKSFLIKKKVKAIGFKEHPEKYFNDYHFAFVSRYLSILEAFAAQRIVFAVYDNPVKEDYLRMAPFAKWIMIAKDSQELVSQVEFILQHPKLKRR